jgi:hypothetical protein
MVLIPMEAVERRHVYNWWPKVKDGGMMVGDDVIFRVCESKLLLMDSGSTMDSKAILNICRGVEGWFSQG